MAPHPCLSIKIPVPSSSFPGQTPSFSLYISLSCCCWRMERLGVHRKRLKRSKGKTKPIKVVYIANPVRVTTSAATFRSLVQKLTGRDADTAELDTTSCSSPSEPADDASTASAPASVASPDSSGSVPSEPSTSGGVQPDNSLVAPVEVFEEGFDAQMMGSFPGFISSILCYEPRVAGLEGFTEV